MTTLKATRERWLSKLAAKMVPSIEKQAGLSIPAYRVTCGFPSRGGMIGYKSRVRGQCWCRSVSEDGHAEIFISPVEDEAETIAAILAHELIHAALPDAGHGKPFQKAARTIGHMAPFTSSAPTPDFLSWAAPMIAAAGRYPHRRLNAVRPGMAIRRSGDDPDPTEPGESFTGLDPEDGGMILVAARKPQKNRHVKCTCEKCGYIARTSRGWIARSGPPHCPDHGAMTADIEDDEMIEAG